MANEPINDVSVALNNLLKTVGTLAQQQLDLLNVGIKAAGQVIEPLVKTSSELLGNVINSLGQVLQSVTSAFAPKK